MCKGLEETLEDRSGRGGLQPTLCLGVLKEPENSGGGAMGVSNLKAYLLFRIGNLLD
jgi:hypothetical protein